MSGVFWIRLFMYTMLSFMIGTLFVGMGTEFDTVQDRISILFCSLWWALAAGAGAEPSHAGLCACRYRGVYGVHVHRRAAILYSVAGRVCPRTPQRCLRCRPLRCVSVFNGTARYEAWKPKLCGDCVELTQRIAGLFVISALSSIIVYFMTGFHSGFDRFIFFLLALFLSLVRYRATRLCSWPCAYAML